jgi:hypothetical protein
VRAAYTGRGKNGRVRRGSKGAGTGFFMRAVVTLVLFLLGLVLIIALRAQWVVFVVWGAFFILQ